MLTLGRLVRGDDLVEGVEALARTAGIRRGTVRCGPGSLMSGCVEAGGQPVEIPGPGAELLVMVGEVGPDGAALHGTVGDPDGRIYAGRFLRGRNPVCITVELAIESLDAAPG